MAITRVSMVFARRLRFGDLSIEPKLSFQIEKQNYRVQLTLFCVSFLNSLQFAIPVVSVALLFRWVV